MLNFFRKFSTYFGLQMPTLNRKFQKMLPCDELTQKLPSTAAQLVDALRVLFLATLALDARYDQLA
jgi:hypothetical protein